MLTPKLRLTSLANLKLASQASRFAASVGLVALLAGNAHAGGPSKVYGHQWAWNNNFQSGLNQTFGSGSTPNMTVWFDFYGSGLLGYPACIHGYHYGGNPAPADGQFPTKMSSTNHVNCTFNYSSGGSNMKGDFAYDMFLRWDNALSKPQLEVMVWAGNNSYPLGKQTGTNVLTAGGHTFDLWEGDNQGAGYYVYTFIPHGTAGVGNLPTSGSLNVDMKPFFNWLQTNRGGSGRYDNKMYLDVVEAGLEVGRGNGWAWIGANITKS